MKKFNPERELYKIKYGKRNKIILVCFFIVLVSIISYSFALYQVRHSKRIIYTTVGEFNSGDITISVLLDGKPVSDNKFPIKGEGFYFDGIECENDDNATANWDYENWKLTSLTTTVPNKCNIKFTTTPSTLIAQIKYVQNTNSEEIIEDETNDKNLRYIGLTPKNYIWFNCDDYKLVINNATAEKQKCEKWRIIGLMNNITIVDETNLTETKNQSLVKIIRANSIGDVEWNTDNKNNWATASLQALLNVTYYNGTAVGYALGITAPTREMIENVKWNIGTWNTYANVLPADYYKYERSTAGAVGALAVWPGKIALMYPSDYAYSVGIAGRDTCLNNNLYPNTSCGSNNWLFEKIHQWTLMPSTYDASYAYYVDWSSPSVYIYGTSTRFGVRPSLYLKSSVKIKSGIGDGSEDSPYILEP